MSNKTINVLIVDVPLKGTAWHALIRDNNNKYAIIITATEVVLFDKTLLDEGPKNLFLGIECDWGKKEDYGNFDLPENMDQEQFCEMLKEKFMVTLKKQSELTQLWITQ